MAEEEMTRAEQVAKRASELAARAEELSRQAHEVSGVDEQLAALEAELDSLVAEEEALDADVSSGQRDSEDAGPDDEWAAWTGTFGERMEALGYRLGDLIAGLDAAFTSSGLGASSFGFGKRGVIREGEAEVTVSGPKPVKVMSDGGSVHVHPGRDDRVHVSWKYRGRGADDTPSVPVTVAERGGTVQVSNTSGRGWKSHVVQIDVEIPTRSPVEVATGGGSVTTEGTRSDVLVKTGGGAVRIEDADGQVVATTGGGSVTVSGQLSGNCSIRTGGGAVDVVLATGTRIDVDAHGTSASIDVPGLNVKGFHVTGTVGGGGNGRLEVKTGGGGVRITEG